MGSIDPFLVYQAYQAGWRAKTNEKHQSMVFYNITTDEVMTVLISGYNPDMWRGLQAMDRSINWKERHEKGTPVIFTPEQAQNTPIFPLPEQDYYCTGNGHPFIVCRDLTKPGKPVVAYFCNFRYKGCDLPK
jgi:hypothetical protein